MTVEQIYQYLEDVLIGKGYNGTHTDYKMESVFKMVKRYPGSNRLMLTGLGRDFLYHPEHWYE